MSAIVIALVVATLAGIVSAQRPAAVDALVQDDKGKPVAEAVVTLHPPGAGAGPGRPPSSAVMDQIDKEFVPHVLPVNIGTTVAFPNRDNIKHHVYSFSPAKKFELPLYTGTPSSPVVFDKSGVVVLGCNIHDWMVAYVFVAPTPYFAKTGADGRARIADVPAGTYEARVWHPRMRVAVDKTAQTVTVPAADPGRLAWSLALKREWRVPRGPGRYDGQTGS
jgi:plastocyanin